MSPSSKNLCILCAENIENKAYRVKLWSEDGEKTETCSKVEMCLEEALSTSTNFKIICRWCLRKVETALKKNEERKELRKSVKEKTVSYMRSRTKRLSQIEGNSRKKLQLDDEKTSLEWEGLDTIEPIKQIETKITGCIHTLFFVRTLL